MAPNKKKSRKPIPGGWKDYFSFNNRVRRGLLVLFGLILIEIMVLLYLHYKPTSAVTTDIQKFKAEVDAFYAAAEKDSSWKHDTEDSRKTYDRPSSFPARDVKSELFSFNPNNLPESEWKRLGFTDKQIRSIKNYEAKGGQFNTREDVKKMYAIREKEYMRLEPYIVIPVTQKDTSDKRVKKGRNFLVVDIGIADSSEFEKLPMIGTYLAQKIYHYREKLGGFYSIHQLKEVRGMRDSTFQMILPHLTLTDSTNLRKINVNTAGFSELNGHPYISNSLANLILNHRNQHGAYHHIGDLSKVTLADEELYRKIAPYLKAE